MNEGRTDSRAGNQRTRHLRRLLLAEAEKFIYTQVMPVVQT